jgi:L-2-hydroxyglutarate oxidase LhgO
MDVDVAIVGAGVIGLAVAQAVARQERTVVVLERAGSFGHGTSSRNSEVVHSGIYYQPGSWKARLCVAGNRRIRELGETGCFPFRPTGKLIVATDEREIPALEDLIRTGEQNGVEWLQLVDRLGARRLEPHVEAVAAIVVPAAGTIDAHAFMRYLAGTAHDGGAMFAYATTLTAAEPIAGGYRLQFVDGDGEQAVTARTVVNAAGLESDRIAALPGLDLDGAGYRLEWVKGNYAQIAPSKARLIGRHVYPAPVYHGVAAGAGAAAFAGLGVHATVSVDGRVRLGPDVEYLDERVEHYEVRPGVAEEFFESARTFLPFLEPDDVTPESSGIRPKRAIARAGFADFVLAEEADRGLPGWVNLVGIESPGLTAALPIADEVVRRLKPYFE